MKQNSKTEFDKMKSGELFNPADKSFLFPLAKAEYYQRRLNKAALWSQKRKERIIKKLVGSIDGNPYNIFIPFRVVFGSNIHIGKNFYAKKRKIKAEEKIRIVQACVEEKLSQAEAASRAGVDEASVRDWLVRYRSEGSLGFVEQDQRAYSAELKLQAVTDYLSGGLSQKKLVLHGFLWDGSRTEGIER